MQAIFLYCVASLSRCRAEYTKKIKSNKKIKNKRRAFGFIRERWCNYNTMKRRLIIVQRAQVDAKAQRIPQGWSVACCSWVQSAWVNAKKLPFKRKQWLRDIFTTFFSLSLSPPFFIQEEQSRLHSEKWQKKQTQFRERTSRPSGHRRSRRIYRGSATPGWWTQSKFM